MRKKIIVLVLNLCCLLILATIADAQQRFAANLSGRQQVPANNSPARGFCAVLLDAAETQIAASCSYSGATGLVNSANIYGNAAPGANAAPIFLFNFTGAASGSFSATFAVTPQQIAALRSNLFYVGIQTGGFNNGEIRGQIKLSNGTYNDYDGDGRTDLSVYRTSENNFYALGSVSGNLTAQAIGQSGDSISLNNDFDGDGLADYAAVRLSQTDGQITWKILQSATSTLRVVVWGNPALGDILAANDYDADGKIDIAVFRAGIWYSIESSTGNPRADYWGQSGDVPAANDYDRDGKIDLAVARSENNQRVWYIRQSASSNQTRRVEWGLSSDAFFVGRTDFDRDGAADILVIRNANGNRVFYVLRSSDNQLQAFNWGLSSDLVRVGDFDGDGRTDFAVSRNSSPQKIWFINQSSDGATRIEYFGLPNDF